MYYEIDTSIYQVDGLRTAQEGEVCLSSSSLSSISGSNWISSSQGEIQIAELLDWLAEVQLAEPYPKGVKSKH